MVLQRVSLHAINAHDVVSDLLVRRASLGLLDVDAPVLQVELD